jgi:hypothetical protein
MNMSAESVYCTNCGTANLPTNAVCTQCGQRLTGPVYQSVPVSTPPPVTQPASVRGTKPGKLQFIAVLCLLDGAANLLWAFLMFLGLFAGNFLACYQTPYCAVLGIMEIIYAINLFSTPIKVKKPAQYLFIMQFINIITLNAATLFIGGPVTGIVSLIIYNDPEVKAYFAAL